MDRVFLQEWLEQAERLTSHKQLDKDVSELKPASKKVKIAVGRLVVEMQGLIAALQNAFQKGDPRDEEEIALLKTQTNDRSDRVQHAMAVQANEDISLEGLRQAQATLQGTDRALFASLINWDVRMCNLLRDEKVLAIVTPVITELLHVRFAVYDRLMQLGVLKKEE